MQWFLAAYGAVSLIHLFFCWSGRSTLWQKGTKVLLMPLLLGAVACSGKGPALLWAALTLGWIGDVLLLWPDRPAFFLGGLVSFLAGHGCYIPLLLGKRALPWGWAAVIGAALAGVGTAAYLSLRKSLPRWMKLPALAYLTVILAMAFSAWLSSVPALIGGAMLFVLSDYLLARGLFVRKLPRGDFLVILTYLLAQALISLHVT